MNRNSLKGQNDAKLTPAKQNSDKKLQPLNDT